MTIKSSSCFERINKLDRDYSYRQMLTLVCAPIKYHVTQLLFHQSLSTGKDFEYREYGLFDTTPAQSKRQPQKSHEITPKN